jgi:hypothetical protein
MKIQNDKIMLIFSATLVAIFILLQLLFVTVSSGGAWCSPYLGAPVELGHSAYQFSHYGVPFPFVTVVHENCFEAQSTTYEWSPIGLGIDLALLLLFAAPLWSRLLRKKE